MRSGDLLAGRYRLVEPVASGGMGEVWKGHDDRLDRVVAIKVLHPTLSHDEVFQRRFHIEARAVAALQAPGVVNIFDYGEETSGESPIVYLVMEFVDGRSLQDILNDGARIDPTETMRIIAGSARALEAAHQAGIIHRDVKPGNILIDKHGDPRIVDFGIARTTRDSGLTSTGMVMGTVSYVAPEQLRGDEPSPAADVYSLGVVAYQCLAGRKPYESDLPATVITATLHDPPPPLPDDVNETFAAIVMRALEKDPADRWPTAAAFADACRGRHDSDGDDGATAVVHTPQSSAGSSASTSEPVTPPPSEVPTTPPEPTETEPPRRHRRLGLVFLLVLALAVLVGSGFVARSWFSHPHHDSGTSASSPSASDSQESKDKHSPSHSSSAPTSDGSSSQDKKPTPSTHDKPKKYHMPDEVGKNNEDAITELYDLGFENTHSELSGTGNLNCVTNMEPKGDAYYPHDQRITLTVVRFSENDTSPPQECIDNPDG